MEVNVLQTVEVVMGIEVSIEMVGELRVMVPEVVGATTVTEDPTLEAELAYSLFEATEVVSALEAWVLESLLE